MKKLVLFSLTAAGIAGAGMMIANAGQMTTPAISQQQMVAPQNARQLSVNILQQIKDGSAQLIGSQIAVNQNNNQVVTQYTKIYRLSNGKLVKLTHTSHSVIKPIHSMAMKPMIQAMPIYQQERMPITMSQKPMRRMNISQMQAMQQNMAPMMRSMQQEMQQNMARMMYMNPMLQMPMMPTIHIKLIAPQYNIIHTALKVKVKAPTKRMRTGMSAYEHMKGPIIGGFVNTRLPNTKIKFLNNMLPGTKIKLRTHIVKQISPILYQIKDGKYTTYVVIPSMAWQFQTITPSMTVQLFGTIKQLPNGRNIVIVHRVYHN